MAPDAWATAQSPGALMACGSEPSRSRRGKCWRRRAMACCVLWIGGAAIVTARSPAGPVGGPSKSRRTVRDRLMPSRSSTVMSAGRVDDADDGVMPLQPGWVGRSPPPCISIACERPTHGVAYSPGGGDVSQQPAYGADLNIRNVGLRLSRRWRTMIRHDGLCGSMVTGVLCPTSPHLCDSGPCSAP